MKIYGAARNPQSSRNGLTWLIQVFCMLVAWNCAIWVAAGTQESESLSDAQIRFFESKIRPVLVEKCYSCHSADSSTLAGSLALDSKPGLLIGGDSGPAIEPGNVDDSLLIQAIRYEDADTAMPPKKNGGKLSDAVIKDFEEWVAMGAPDPRSSSAVPIDPGAGEQARLWWSFQPLTVPALPQLNSNTVRGQQWPKSNLDHFVLQKLQQAELEPVADAEPLALLRRGYFDLIGLPPTPEQTQGFLQRWQAADSESSRDQLWMEVVDSLLDSPQFGERWGRHWLDVARFAESSGRDVNITYPYAWRYRDYVIDALNRDMPFDQFVQEQIAGDLLNSSSDQERSRKLIASGFLAIGPKSLNEQNPRQLALDVADEQIDAVSQSFLGMTFACARCHDHKFDPVSQKEYTALAGIFLSTETHYGTTGAVGGRNAGKLVELPDDQVVVLEQSLTSKELDQKRQRIETLEAQREEALRARRAERMNSGNPPSGIDLTRITTQLAVLRTELEGYDERGNPKRLAMGVADRPSAAPRSGLARRDRAPERPRRVAGFVSIGDSPLFVRGETNRPSETVPRGFPTLLDSVSAPKIPSGTSGRLQLAEWIIDPRNPLTSRVIVNRVWHWLFGAGLVTSVDNFGTSGVLPSHPELLDYLAAEFVADGWSIKQLIREIVNSRTYRLSTTYDPHSFRVDPSNTLLWRHQPKRLQAEVIRDSMLQAAGILDLKPPVGSLIGRAGDGLIDNRRRAGISEVTIAEFDDRHRSIYLPAARNVESSLLGVFNAPDGDVVQGAREITNVPSQALFLLNSSLVTKAAESISRQAYNSAKGQRQNARFEDVYQELSWVLYSRPASDREVVQAKKLFGRYKNTPAKGYVAVARAMLASAEFRSSD